MAEQYSINGKSATLADYQALRELLAQTPLGGSDALHDTEFSRAEILRLFDSSGKSGFDLQDVVQLHQHLSSGALQTLDGLLSKHGFRLAHEIPQADITALQDTCARQQCSGKPWASLWSNAAFVRAMVARMPASAVPLRYAAPTLQDDRAVVQEAVQRNGLNLKFASPQLRGDPAIVRTAVNNDAMALAYADASLRDDRETVRTAIRTGAEQKKGGAGILQFASGRLRKDRGLALEAILHDGRNIQYVDSSLLCERKFVREAVRWNGMALAGLRGKAEQCPSTDPLLTGERTFTQDAYRKDPIVAEAAIYQNVDAFEFVHPELQRSVPFLVDAALYNHTLLTKITNTRLRAQVWEGVVQHFPKLGIHFPDDVVASYEIFRRNVTVPNPDDVPSILELYRFDRQEESQLPLAVFLFNTSDHNGAFQRNPVVKNIRDSGKFRTAYRAVSTEADVWKALRDITGDGKQKIHTLIIAGHGEYADVPEALKPKSPRRLMLGKDTLQAVTGEEYFIDIDDIQSGQFNRLIQYLDPRGQILLYSCSTGRGGQAENNLVNALASILPLTFRIMAPRVDTNISAVTVAADYRLKVSLWSGEMYETSGRGRVSAKSSMPAKNAVGGQQRTTQPPPKQEPQPFIWKVRKP